MTLTITNKDRMMRDVLISGNTSIIFFSTVLGLFLGYQRHDVANPAIVGTPQIKLAERQSEPVNALQWASRPIQFDSIVTAYCPCPLCCGDESDGKTSRGRDAYTTRGVAVDPSIIPYGSIVSIPGYGSFVADDTGGAMRNDGKKGIVHIDLRFNNHHDALVFGRQHLKITVEER